MVSVSWTVSSCVRRRLWKEPPASMKPPPPGRSVQARCRHRLDVLTTAVATVVSASKPWKLVLSTLSRIGWKGSACQGPRSGFSWCPWPGFECSNRAEAAGPWCQWRTLIAMRGHVGLNGPARVHEVLERVFVVAELLVVTQTTCSDVLAAKAVCHGRTTLLYFRIHVVVR